MTEKENEYLEVEELTTVCIFHSFRKVEILRHHGIAFGDIINIGQILQLRKDFGEIKHYRTEIRII